MTELEQILDSFGKKLVIDVRNSWMAAKQAKASKHGSTLNPNSRLAASMRYDVVYDDKGVSMVFSMDKTYVFPDSGRNKGGVSKDGQASISEWIKRSGIKPKINVKPKATAKVKRKSIKITGKQSYEKQVKSMVYLISRKLKEKGYEGSHFYSKVINDGRLVELRRQIAEQFKKDINVTFSTN